MSEYKYLDSFNSFDEKLLFESNAYDTTNAIINSETTADIVDEPIFAYNKKQSNDDLYLNISQKICNNVTHNLSVINFEALCSNQTIQTTVDYNEIQSGIDYESSTLMENIISIVVPILFGIIVIVGLFGNALVVMVVMCNQQMRSTTNLLIINLAIADLLFIVFCVPFTAWDYAFPYWPFGDVWCRIVQYLIVVCAYASIYTLVLMSLDRYLAVAHPIRSMSVRTERNAYFAIYFTWITIFLACIPALISHGEVMYSPEFPEYSVCIFLTDNYINRSIYQVCFFLSSYLIPIFIILLLYILMLKRLWFGAVPGGHMSAESVRSKKRVTRMVVVVVIIFAFCWCPIQVVLVLRSFDHYDLTTANIIIQIAAHILAYMNSCVNPILYAFLSENFRKAFHKVIVCHTNNARQRSLRSRAERTDRETTVGTTCNVTKTTTNKMLINGNV